ncbi:MAG: hypothetical protein AAGF71_03450 [Pseudomonadota bacterium]
MSSDTSTPVNVEFNGGFVQGSDTNENFIVNTPNGTINGGKGNDTASITVDPEAAPSSFQFDGGDGTDTVSFDFTKVNFSSLLVSLIFSGPFAIIQMLGISYFLRQFEKYGMKFGSLHDQVDLADDFTNIRTGRQFDISAGAGNDEITGVTGGSVVFGDQGNDTLKGGNGSILYGGLNRDTFFTSLSGQNAPSKTTVDGGKGQDTATVENIFNKNEIMVTQSGNTTEVSASRASPVGPVVSEGTFKRVENLTLDLSQASTGEDDPVTVTMEGQKDLTAILADADADKGLTIVFANTKPNNVTLKGQANGNLNGRAGGDTLEGNEGNNKIRGDRGDDIIGGGGGGQDTLRGGKGDDTILGENAGAGSIFEGGNGNDEIFADGSAGVTVRCGNGSDFISVDTADPFAGDTIVEGGRGKDYFSIGVAEGQNSGGVIRVLDFTTGDNIVFQDGGNLPVEPDDLDFRQEGNDVVVGLENQVDGSFVEVRFEGAQVQEIINAATPEDTPLF